MEDEESASAECVLDSWEEAENNTEVDKQMEAKLKKQKKAAQKKQDSTQQTGDASGTADSMNQSPAQQKITILQRPSSQKDLSALDGHGLGQRTRSEGKSLQQRAAAYAEARKRIMGSSHDDDGEVARIAAGSPRPQPQAEPNQPLPQPYGAFPPPGAYPFHVFPPRLTQPPPPLPKAPTPPLSQENRPRIVTRPNRGESSKPKFS